MTVAAIHRYPVKSMLGESLGRCRIGATGVVGDRAYALIDVETGTVASAKVPKRWAGLLDFSARFVAEPIDGETPPPVEIAFPDGSVLRSDDEKIDHALTAALGRAVRLTTTPPDGAYFEELWPEIDGLAPPKVIAATETRREDTGEVISRFDISPFAAAGTFFDLSALHVLTESTLDRLRELAPDATFDARRYRPNFVLRETDADAGRRDPSRGDRIEPGFVENDWPGRTVTIGEARIRFSFATMRCVMTTLAQGGADSGLPNDADTLRAIAKHNRIEIPQLGGVWACAGVYADVAEPGDVAVGDPYAEATD